MEFDNYLTYGDRFPGAACNLGQDAVAHPQCTRSGRHLMTILRKPDIIMSPYHKKWLAPFAHLSTLMYPVYPCMRSSSSSSDVVHCSFQRDPCTLGLSARTRSNIMKQSGNGMNLATAGAAICWILEVGILMICYYLSSSLLLSPSSHVFVFSSWGKSPMSL